MKLRKTQIYKDLYHSPKSKLYFSELFGITTKSVENTMKKYSEDIVYDRKLSKYRFKELLPSLIPVEIYFNIFKDSIANQIIKEDMLSAIKQLSSTPNSDFHLMATDTLSYLSKYIIKSHIAIGHSCILKISYDSIKKPTETKYIKPHKITSTGFVYYLYGSYEKRNKKDVGEYRSFAFNSIKEMSVVEYLKDEDFSIDAKSNAYGVINKEKYVVLKLKGASASFFKRERQFEREEFEFVMEEVDGTISIKMYYNNIDEVVYLLQQWMPLISVDSTSPEKESIYKIIEKNYRELIGITDTGEDDES